jgi:hypothetical protein
MAMSQYLSVGQTAVEVGGEYRARDVSDVLYQRRDLAARCLLIAGRRAVPREMVPELRRLLDERRARRAAHGPAD